MALSPWPSALSLYLAHLPSALSAQPLALSPQPFAWLQNRGMLSQEWAEGQVLMYLPEPQALLLEEASRQGKSAQVARILEPDKIPELQEIQCDSRCLSHGNPEIHNTDRDG